MPRLEAVNTTELLAQMLSSGSIFSPKLFRLQELTPKLDDVVHIDS